MENSQNQTKAKLKPPASDSKKLSGHILLVDDDLVNQEIGKAMLSAIGCHVEVVNNGLEAVKFSADKHVDAILMDCHMPIMDGFQATAEIRDRENMKGTQNRVPIIALTSDEQKGIIAKCKNAGMDDYVRKPVDLKQLKDVLEKWLPLEQAKPEQSSIKQTIQGANTDGKILNLTIIDNIRQQATIAGENLLSKIVTLFSISAPKEVDQLQSSFDKKDYVSLAMTAHKIKSSCAHLGIQTLADCAESIETNIRQNDFEEIEPLLNTLKLELPNAITALKKELDTSENEATTTQPKIQPQLEGCRNKHILLVDDDTSFRLIASTMLTASSFIVDEANNGIEAIEKINQHTPDIVLLDAIMDQMDGFETCRLLRESPNMTDVPIIMSTGLDDIESINSAFESGATDFFVKPINYPILIHRINFMLRAGQDAIDLRNSKLQLTAAQRIARLGYWIWDVKQNHFQLSEQLADLCNIDLQLFDQSLESFISLIEPEDQSLVQEMIMEAPYDTEVQHIEYRLLVNQAEHIIVHQEMVKIIENGRFIITGTVQDISQRKATEKQIHYLAYFDNLTGLASRTYYQERIQAIIKTAKRRNERFAFLFLDLDGFKDINDSLGHDIGDKLLKIIAERLKGVIRNADFAARLGGDEFCILLNNIHNDEFVTEIAERCLLKINEPLFLNHQQIKPRVSIGIAIFPRDGSSEVDLMKAADTAMYAAKQAGKQCYVFYSQEMAIQAITRLEKEHMLREAFEKEQFILHYQPQICMQTGRMIGMEALTRWQHPENGMIPLDEYIPEIERLGLLIELGDWALKTACEQIMQWHDAGLPFMQVAVNLSALHFQNAELLNKVQEILAKTGVPAKYLELEVTESAIQVEGCLNMIKQLRTLGIKISIDDFGTGYSCLVSLKQFPLCTLKIDKVFVGDVATNSQTALLLGTIIGLAKAFDYTLIAEGVETEEQALIMHGMGCQIIQGNFFSHAISSDIIPTLIDADFSKKTEKSR